MVGLKKRGVITAVAGILAAVTITGCSAAPDNDATVVTVGTEKVSYGVANFIARMQQAQYESFYCRPDGDECGHNVEPGSGRRQDI